MKIKKQVMINKELLVILSYDNSIFEKYPSQLHNEGFSEVEMLFGDFKIKLHVNGETYYDNLTESYEDDFYFEVVVYKKDNERNEYLEVEFSEPIYETVSNEEELIEIMQEFWNLEEVALKKCPLGFNIGWCNEDTGAKCEYSALRVDGYCGAECTTCGGDIYAYGDTKTYKCTCCCVEFSI